MDLLKSSLGFLRIIAFLEGVSFLLLIFIAMPLKYFADTPEPNLYIGMGHGALFILYVALVFWVKMERHWSVKNTGLALLASIVPFGTFVADRRLFRE